MLANKESKRAAHFGLKSKYGPAGDQPQAIKSLVEADRAGVKRQTLLGVTGSGKTFTIAHVIEQLARPVLVIAHNKTLAAQLYSEFKELFPENAVRYFVSYYDYYQPEAYVPSSDTYIEKDASVNAEIDKLRHASTKALLERKDVIVVSSVSCIYGLGDPNKYFEMMLYLELGDEMEREEILGRLVELQYERDEVDFQGGTFRVRGDVIEVAQASESERSLRIELYGDEVEAISEIDRLSGKVIRKLADVCIYPASHYVTDKQAIKQAISGIRKELKQRLGELERLGKTLEATRLEQRTLYDLELLEEMGFCSGIENYSRHITQAAAGQPPPTLLDYFADDFLTIIDESHVTVSQLRGMYRGDRARKKNLVEHGFRLPSAIDNRPLQLEEFMEKVGSLIFVSATPGKYEAEVCEEKVVEQIIRPTGLLDPQIEVRPASEQVDDLLAEIRRVVERGEKVLVTTLTKKMAEHLSEYYQEVGVRVKYLHSEIHTLDRIDIIRGLQENEFDVLIGVNLLREGLDLPEVSLVGILDADKEGFLRSQTSLVQTIGRAARNVSGLCILYADKVTDSMRRAMDETQRRREIQGEHNKKHGIEPRSVERRLQSAMLKRLDLGGDEMLANMEGVLPKSQAEGVGMIKKLRKEMLEFAAKYEFEKAAELRDRISSLEKFLLSL